VPISPRWQPEQVPMQPFHHLVVAGMARTG